MKGLRILWATWLLCLANLSVAQPTIVSAGLDPSKPVGQYIIEKWGPDQGLPTNTLSGLMQDRDGYLWIATLAGLVRFDGVRFVCFNRENTPDMPLSAVLSVIQSKQGHFWLGSSGKGLLRYEAGRVTAYYTQESGLASNVTDVLLEDREGTLWVGGRDNGLSAISRDGKLLSLRLPYERPVRRPQRLYLDRNPGQGHLCLQDRQRIQAVHRPGRRLAGQSRDSPLLSSR
jgi:ligand-binding sensor domain-containing protein